MGTKNKPGAFDCYANAEPDEPMFVLLARDPVASMLVRAWAHIRVALDGSDVKVGEALECADAMEQWQRANRPNKSRPVWLLTFAEGIDSLTAAMWRLRMAIQRDADDGARNGAGR